MFLRGMRFEPPRAVIIHSIFILFVDVRLFLVSAFLATFAKTRIPYYVIPQLDWGISIRNFRIPYYVILGLDPRISIWNSKFICDEIPRSSRGMTQGLGILEFLNEFKI